MNFSRKLMSCYSLQSGKKFKHFFLYVFKDKLLLVENWFYLVLLGDQNRKFSISLKIIGKTYKKL